MLLLVEASTCRERLVFDDDGGCWSLSLTSRSLNGVVVFTAPVVVAAADAVEVPVVAVDVVLEVAIVAAVTAAAWLFSVCLERRVLVGSTSFSFTGSKVSFCSLVEFVFDVKLEVAVVVWVLLASAVVVAATVEPVMLLELVSIGWV